MAALTAESPSLVRPAGTKLAVTVARRIVNDVVERDWPVGEVLGSEADLIGRYGVSRAVFREAVRLVENQQVAHMRRGPGGGLVVTEPTVDAVIDATVLYLHRVNTSLDEVFEARLALEEIVTDLAADRMDEADLLALRALMDGEADGTVRDHTAMHRLLASLSKNPALELFVDIFNRVALLYFRQGSSVSPTTLGESQRAHLGIARAVMAGDSDVARRRMRSHLRAESAFLQQRKLSRQYLSRHTALGGAVSNKRAEDVARAMLDDVVAGDLVPGHLLGSQSELIERYGASQAVFREAMRLLEHHRIASMRRGPGGGVFVSAPSVHAVSEVVAVFLERRRISTADLVELRIRVELALAELATARMDDEGGSALASALERERASGQPEFADAGHDFHAVIAGLAANRALELVALVLIRLTRLHQVETVSERARARAAEEVSRAHAAIAEAMAEGDAVLARSRLRWHLQAIGAHLR